MMESPRASPVPFHADPELEKKHQLEKQFHVKNIPADFDEWKVFHSFREFGLVDDIRLPSFNPQQNRFRYGFVTMCTYEDADKVRSAIRDGSLKVLDGTVFKVENVNLNNFRNCDNNKENNTRQRGFGPTNRNQNARAPFGNAKSNATNQTVKTDTKPAFAQTISPGRLSVVGAVDAEMAQLPSNTPESPFVFYVKEKNKTKDNRFLLMESRMLEVVKQPPLNADIAKELTCAIVIYEQRPARAQIIRDDSKDTPTRMAYLVDEGKEIAFLPHAAWAMPSDVAIVPAMVCECTFAGTEMMTGQERAMPSLRTVLEQISTRARLCLNTIYLEGRLNCVTARSIFVHPAGNVEEADLVDGLVKKKLFKIDPSAVLPRLYTRDDMLAIQLECKEAKLDENIAREFSALAV